MLGNAACCQGGQICKNKSQLVRTSARFDHRIPRRVIAPKAKRPVMSQVAGAVARSPVIYAPPLFVRPQINTWPVFDVTPTRLYGREWAPMHALFLLLMPGEAGEPCYLTHARDYEARRVRGNDSGALGTRSFSRHCTRARYNMRHQSSRSLRPLRTADRKSLSRLGRRVNEVSPSK